MSKISSETLAKMETRHVQSNVFPVTSNGVRAVISLSPVKYYVHIGAEKKIEFNSRREAKAFITGIQYASHLIEGMEYYDGPLDFLPEKAS